MEEHGRKVAGIAKNKQWIAAHGDAPNCLSIFPPGSCSQFDEAATAITQALSIDAHDPWAIHVQAHLLYARGAQVEGAPWLEERAHVWEGCMSFLYSHWFEHTTPPPPLQGWDRVHASLRRKFARRAGEDRISSLFSYASSLALLSRSVCTSWFHLALLRQDADETDAVLGIFDHAVWPHHTPDQADEAAAPAGPVPLAVKRLQQRASASASAPASASADQSQPLQPEEEQSFGVSPTPLSFQRHDRSYIEDQNGALNLLWRLEMRVAGAGSLDGPRPRCPGRGRQRGPLRCAALSSRWGSIVSTLALPPAQPLSLFGLLQLHALCRVGKMEEARQFLALLQAQVAQVADPQRRAALGGQSLLAGQAGRAPGGCCGAKRRARPVLLVVTLLWLLSDVCFPDFLFLFVPLPLSRASSPGRGNRALPQRRQ